LNIVCCRVHNDCWYMYSILRWPAFVLRRICFCPNNILCKNSLLTQYIYIYIYIYISFTTYLLHIYAIITDKKINSLQLPCIMWLAIYKPKKFSFSWIANWVRKLDIV
jgi:hypothetical protein